MKNELKTMPKERSVT